MTTLIAPATASELPEGSTPARADGLLVGVQRPCPDHDAPRCACVGSTSDGHMVFWCPAGAHHFSAHPRARA
ncbi:MAG: hypothetical protein U0Y82_11490 [Thermoleophilia bacterium]|mgnify:CR=1 FL=1